MTDSERARSAAGDPRFFERSGPRTLGEIAAAIGGDVAVTGDAARVFTGVAPLQSAGPDQVSFLDNKRYAALLAEASAGAVIVHPDMAGRVPAGCAALVTREPYLAWARAATLFFPPPPVRPGVHPSAIVDGSAKVDPTAEIGPFCVVGARAEIGARCVLGVGAAIGEGVLIGPDSRIGTHCSVSHAIIGARVRLFPGVRIGQEGFGFATSAAGFVAVPQLGRVVLEDDVEVGANSCIDRGSVHDTVIGAGSRLDNLVMIGHNVRLGRCCVIVSQAGVSGSTILEDFVQVAGQAGLAGHLHVGQGARIGAQAGIMADVPAKADVLGSPGVPVREFFRQVVTLKRLSAKNVRDRGRSVGSPTEETGSG